MVSEADDELDDELKDYDPEVGEAWWQRAMERNPPGTTPVDDTPPWWDCRYYVRVSAEENDGREYFGPKWLRCDVQECRTLVTRVHIDTLGCCPECGNRKMRRALKLTDEERRQIEAGEIPLNTWETRMVRGA